MNGDGDERGCLCGGEWGSAYLADTARERPTAKKTSSRVTQLAKAIEGSLGSSRDLRAAHAGRRTAAATAHRRVKRRKLTAHRTKTEEGDEGRGRRVRRRGQRCGAPPATRLCRVFNALACARPRGIPKEDRLLKRRDWYSLGPPGGYCGRGLSLGVHVAPPDMVS